MVLSSFEPMVANVATSARPRQALRARGLAECLMVVLGAALIWAYWPTLTTMVERWLNDPQYSHGFLVPVFAAALLWMRRNRYPERVGWPSGWGLVLLICAAGIRLVATRINYDGVDPYSLLLTLAALVLLVGGWPMLRWTWPAIAYLGFMLPLPYMIEQGMSQPLRRLATLMSTYLLECLGQPAVAEGHVILIDDMQLKVAEACSGLGMLMTFFALSTAMALLVKRSRIEKVVIVASAIPIAVLANVLRITITGVAVVWLGQSAGMFFMHKLAGWLMPPMAILMLWLEIRLIDVLFPREGGHAPLNMRARLN